MLETAYDPLSQPIRINFIRRAADGAGASQIWGRPRQHPGVSLVSIFRLSVWRTPRALVLLYQTWTPGMLLFNPVDMTFSSVVQAGELLHCYMFSIPPTAQS